MTSINDHRNEDGSADWEAYHAAQVLAGDICQTCGRYIINIRAFGPAREPAPQDCVDCQRMNDTCEVTHDKFIRCPSCKHRWDPAEYEDYQVFKEDGDEVCCSECDHEFHVGTSVRYTFTSPELVKEEGSE